MYSSPPLTSTSIQSLTLILGGMPIRPGTVSIREGSFLTAADTFDVRVFGRGGHDSSSHTT